eukprot:COSAG05_NODE_1819_length_4019_cov_8.560714_4_plen_492_part_01
MTCPTDTRCVYASADPCLRGTMVPSSAQRERQQAEAENEALIEEALAEARQAKEAEEAALARAAAEAAEKAEAERVAAKSAKAEASAQRKRAAEERTAQKQAAEELRRKQKQAAEELRRKQKHAEEQRAAQIMKAAELKAAVMAQEEEQKQREAAKQAAALKAEKARKATEQKAQRAAAEKLRRKKAQDVQEAARLTAQQEAQQVAEAELAKQAAKRERRTAKLKAQQEAQQEAAEAQRQKKVAALHAEEAKRAEKRQSKADDLRQALYAAEAVVQERRGEKEAADALKLQKMAKHTAAQGVATALQQSQKALDLKRRKAAVEKVEQLAKEVHGAQQEAERRAQKVSVAELKVAELRAALRRVRKPDASATAQQQHPTMFCQHVPIDVNNAATRGSSSQRAALPEDPPPAWATETVVSLQTLLEGSSTVLPQLFEDEASVVSALQHGPSFPLLLRIVTAVQRVSGFPPRSLRLDVSQTTTLLRTAYRLHNVM